MVTGMLSHQLKQHVIDGEKTIIQNPTDQQKYVRLCAYPLNVSSGWFLSSCFCRKDHEKAEFEVHEVYAVDVLVSTGEGKVRGNNELVFNAAIEAVAQGCGVSLHIFVLLIQAKDGGQRTTVYKRDPNKVYGLKMKSSRMLFSDIERRFDTMPFTLRLIFFFIFMFFHVMWNNLNAGLHFLWGQQSQQSVWPFGHMWWTL